MGLRYIPIKRRVAEDALYFPIKNAYRLNSTKLEKEKKNIARTEGELERESKYLTPELFG